MRKGFTLIELLAVIVILAIIALIATPIILGIINDAKEDSEKRSIENYAHAVELSVARYAAEKGGVIPVGTYKTDDNDKTKLNKIGGSGSEFLTVDYKGEKIDATVEITVTGEVKITDASLDNEKTKYNYTESGGVTKVETDSENNDTSKEEITSFAMNWGGKKLIYYKGKGDVKLPAVIDGIEIEEVGSRAFSKSNVITLNYEVLNETCQASSSCAEQMTIFVLDSSVEDDLRNYYTNNNLGYEVEIIVPSSSEEIKEKIYELGNSDNIDLDELTPEYMKFKDGELVEDAVGYETEITSLDLSDTKIVSMEWGAIEYLQNLRIVTLPRTVEDMSKSTFSHLDNLEKIIVPFKENEIPSGWNRWNYDDDLGIYYPVEYAG